MGELIFTAGASGADLRSYRAQKYQANPFDSQFVAALREIADLHRTPDGRWHSAWKVRVPARPILPRAGELPARWAEAFETVLRERIARSLGGG